MQRARRTNHYPLTWEIPVLVAVGVVCVLVVAAQLGRSLANLLAGTGWVFVDRDQLVTSVGGVLAGDVSAGLHGVSPTASAGALWTWVAIIEAVTVACCAIGGKAALDRWGPTRMLGMATRHEAEQLMGRTRLRKSARVVRPDLYGREGTR